jgi:hypothetical protein
MGRGIKAKKKTPADRTKKYHISDKQLERIKMEVAEEVNRKSCLLCIAAMADHLELTEDQICETAEVITRWASYLDQKVLSINEVAEIIEKKTGIKFGGF